MNIKLTGGFTVLTKESFKLELKVKYKKLFSRNKKPGSCNKARILIKATKK